MPASKEYLQKAEECYRPANEAKTDADRLACLDLARSWLDASLSEVAVSAETYKLGDEPTAKTRRGWRRRIVGFFR